MMTGAEAVKEMAAMNVARVHADCDNLAAYLRRVGAGHNLKECLETVERLRNAAVAAAIVEPASAAQADRDAVIEEAAKVCDKNAHTFARHVAPLIRSLKSSAASNQGSITA